MIPKYLLLYTIISSLLSNETTRYHIIIIIPMIIIRYHVIAVCNYKGYRSIGSTLVYGIDLWGVDKIGAIYSDQRVFPTTSVILLVCNITFFSHYTTYSGYRSYSVSPLGGILAEELFTT